MVAVSLSLKNQLPRFQVLPGELDCAQQLLSKVPNCGHFIEVPSFVLLSVDFSCNHSDSSSFHGLCYALPSYVWDKTGSGTGTSDSHRRMATQRIFFVRQVPLMDALKMAKDAQVK